MASLRTLYLQSLLQESDTSKIYYVIPLIQLGLKGKMCLISDKLYVYVSERQTRVVVSIVCCFTAICERMDRCIQKPNKNASENVLLKLSDTC